MHPQAENDLALATHRLDRFAHGTRREKLEILREAEPQRVLLELARREREARVGVPTECPPRDALDDFCTGLMPPIQQVEVARHAAGGCSACARYLDIHLRPGQAKQSAAIGDTVRALRIRRYAQTNELVHRSWRSHLKWNIVMTLAETAASTAVIIGPLGEVCRPHLELLGALALGALALLVLVGFMVLVLHRVLYWRDHTLVDGLHPDWFTKAVPRPSRPIDLSDTWRQVTQRILELGVTSYTLWGVLASVITGTGEILFLAVSLGIIVNLLAWRRLNRVDLAVFRKPPVPRVARPHMSWEDLRSYLRNYVAEYAVVLLAMIPASYTHTSAIVFLVIAAMCVVGTAMFKQLRVPAW